MTHHADLLDTLAGIVPDSPLALARATREAATLNIAQSYEALFKGDSALTRAERLRLAREVARWHEDDALSAHYAAALGHEPEASARIGAALGYAEILAFRPVQATAQDVATLGAAGFSEEAIVTLAQVVAFVSFQSRALRGYRLIGGRTVTGDTAVPPAGRWHTEPTTQRGEPAPTAFTQDELGWAPWVAPKALAAFSPDEQETLRRFGHQDSDYFRLLARNLPVLEARTLTDKGIFYTPGGLARAERELAATVASKVNGCIYCASVHARKASQLSKANDAVQRLLEVAPGESLSAGQSARWKAIIDFSAALSATPSTASAAHVAALRDEGLTDLELLDLVQATAFFAWANRLMLTLGEPFIPA
ncbi:alkylhydroperoxidase domain protein [Cronobacter dublinensis subsp. dublinensis]|nr:alkylhydroperoxidase domain protein [Cronobacter dublinensis subsp. dublinensis]EGT5668617.1 alkylhydroperoxidase domain protein [Cronobacter dublinensis subsp. dublinensis]EGT5671822.1 alkylhydroperoxidase domain protein [Cronobacter dublinensis subsp. dublinensis]EGT5679053.1 alkylhydroperoxidase domain protein [Cronobacter dublinensis subsp. dublinensis]EGT5684843.1 alkylhydroperoxidase domain protein [Cronobacter dublinensis subsp. dublinensis]